MATLSPQVQAKWLALNNQSTADGSSVQDYLGSPVGEGFSPTADSQAQYFERGVITVAVTGAAFVVYGGIYLKYRQLGGPAGFLGMPHSDEMAAGGARCSTFDRGEVIWSAATGAHVVGGAILQRYAKLGGPAGILGAPTSDELPVLHQSKEIGRFNTFQNGGSGIWFSDATGAWEVLGAIGDLWRNIYGGPAGGLGFPTCGESDTPNAAGRYNEFTHGLVVWHPSGTFTGAFALFNLEVFIDHFESNFNPYHVQAKVQFTDPDSAEEKWFPSDKDYASNPRALWAPTIPLVRHDTVVTVWLDGLGHHTIGDDERLGIVQARYDISNLWGLLDRTNPHAANQDHNNSFHFNAFFNLRTVAPGTLGPFQRRTHWWPYHNFDTPVLSFDQMAQTYTDVHEDETNFWHPFDDIFYNLLYKSSAAKGNCFGMCVEALYARHNASLFPEPIFSNPLIQYPPIAAAGLLGLDPAKEPDDARLIAPVNIKFGYQFGNSVIDWVGGKLLSGSLSDPVSVFHETQSQFASGDWPILSLTKGGIGSDGHAVLPYRWDSSSTPWRIFIANPNSPASSVPADDDPSNVVFVDPVANTFRLQMSSTETWSGGKSGSGMILSVPFHLLADEPATPFWEVAALISALTLIIVFGDGDTTQVSDGNGRTMLADGRPPVDGGTAPFNMNPATRLAGVQPMLMFNPRNQAALFHGYRVARMPPLRRAGQAAEVPDQNDKALQIIHEITPVGSGSYAWMTRGPGGSFHASVSGGLSPDTVTIGNFGRAEQSVTFRTAAGGPAKRATLTVGGGQAGSKSFKAFTLSEVVLPAGGELSVTTENAGQAIVLHSPSHPLQFDLQLQAGKTAKSSRRQGVSLDAGGTMRLTPTDWSETGLSHTPVTIETVVGIGGKVLGSKQI